MLFVVERRSYFAIASAHDIPINDKHEARKLSSVLQVSFSRFMRWPVRLSLYLKKFRHTVSGPNVVPTDNVRVEASKAVLKLMLPRGEFRIVAED